MKTPLLPGNRLFIDTLALLAIGVFWPGSARATLVYYLPFDDGTNSTLTNYGSVGGTATVEGTAPTASTVVPGNLDSAYAERTTNSTTRIVLPDSTAQFRLDGTGQAMTLSLWVYIDAATANWSGLIGNSSSGTGWGLSVSDASIIRMEINGTGGSGNRTTVDTVALKTWFNLTVTWNTSVTNSAPLTIYINGTNMARNQTGAPTIMKTSSAPITLRGNANQVIFDDLAMWDTVLGPGEIRALTAAPAVLAGYDVGVLNPLFASYETASAIPITVGGVVWSYATGFDVTARTLGDVWQVGGNYYMWLGGSDVNSSGLIGLSTIPEPAEVGLLIGVLSAGLVVWRRKNRNR